MLLLLLLSTFSFAEELKPAREKVPEEIHDLFPRKKTDICKMLVKLDSDGCNAVTYEICTDGVMQWETGFAEKTSKECVGVRKNEKPKDELIWGKLENTK